MNYEEQKAWAESMELYTIWYDSDPTDHYETCEELKAVCTTWEKVLELFPSVKWQQVMKWGKPKEPLQGYYYGDEDEGVPQSLAHWHVAKGLKLDQIWE